MKLLFAYFCLLFAGFFVVTDLLNSGDTAADPAAIHARAEAVKANCVRLADTPMSLMTPRDLDDWGFCKSIIVPR
jgi:hypothetical protein